MIKVLYKFGIRIIILENSRLGFSGGILCQVWCLVVSILDFCHLSYFY